MKFTLNKISIWFKKGAKPRELELLPNKVNVITGDSGAGKTNILAIIDYCFLSVKSNIVEQVINENAEWYSVEFSINDTHYFIGRSKTELSQVSSVVCFYEGKNIPQYPLTYPTSNIGVLSAKEKLDSLFGITNKERFPFGKDKGVPKLQVSYRTYLLFNALTERIITLDDIYLDFGYFEDALFGTYKSYIVNKAIGFDERRKTEATECLIQLKKDRDSFERKQKKEQKANKNFIATLQEFLSIFKENGIIPNEYPYSSIQETIDTLKKAIIGIESQSIIEQNNEQLRELRTQRRTLNIQYGNIKRAQKEIEEYKKQLETYEDSLKPIEVLKLKTDEIARSFETQQLINALENSLRQIKNADVGRISNQLANPNDLERIKSQLDVLDKEIAILSKANTTELTTRQFWIAATIKGRLDLLLKEQTELYETKNLLLDNYINECNRLEQIIDKEDSAQPQLKKDTEKAIQFFYNQLNYMANYEGCEVCLDLNKFILKLRKIGTAYPYDTIGSKSNYMFMHLCFFLGFHKHFVSIENNHVLPFLFIDQPSIPYYAGSDTVKNDDKNKLLDAFTLLNNFINTINQEMETDFQILLIEHAPSSYWTEEADLQNFHLVEEFTEGNKLIPQYIIDENK